MPYIYNTPEDQREMLDAIGAASVEELFAPIPDELKLNRPLDLPPALSELELDQHLRQLASVTRHAGQLVCFLGGGSYDHFVPAVCDMVGSRSEFYTSYTPYQAEASQGNLQAMFEYQSLIARLTGMEVANSSLYDGASAAAEAVLMALHAGGSRTKIVVPSSLHPEYRQTIVTYLANLDAEVVALPCPDDRARIPNQVQHRLQLLIIEQQSNSRSHFQTPLLQRAVREHRRMKMSDQGMLSEERTEPRSQLLS